MLVVKSASERGPIGAWLVRERERLHLSADEVALRAGLNVSSYRGIEAGRWKPAGERLAALERVFGARAPDTTKEPRPEWVEALERKVDAVQRVMEGVATEQAAVLAGLGEVLRRTPPLGDDLVDDQEHQRQGQRSDQ